MGRGGTVVRRAAVSVNTQFSNGMALANNDPHDEWRHFLITTFGDLLSTFTLTPIALSSMRQSRRPLSQLVEGTPPLRRNPRVSWRAWCALFPVYERALVTTYTGGCRGLDAPGAFGEVAMRIAKNKLTSNHPSSTARPNSPYKPQYPGIS